MSILNLLSQYWWVIPVLLGVVLYKQALKLFGVIIVPDDSIGLITKKFVLFGANKSLPQGRVIALNGEAGKQAKTLAPGIYFGYWPWQFSIDFCKFTEIENGKLGLISAKDGGSLLPGRVLGDPVECDNFQDAEAFIKNGGVKGKQISILSPGLYRINTLMFDITTTDQVHIKETEMAVITTNDGAPLEEGHIAGSTVQGHSNFQDFGTFIKNGGKRGLQEQVVLAGMYNLNPWAISTEICPLTEVPIGQVAVVISYVGKEGTDISGKEFQHGNIVSKGEKGVWNEPLQPGKYAMNTYTTKVELVPTTNIVLNWADARTESHKLDDKLSTITVRSKDGYSFNLDVSQIIHVPATEAAKVIARFGNMKSLVSQVLEPTIGNYFRNSTQNCDMIEFLYARKERQEDAKKHIQDVLKEYNVIAVDTLIGDINAPAELMKTLTERKLAEEQRITNTAIMESQKTRQVAEKERSLADMQGELVKADQSVIIAEKTANAKIKQAEGESKSIELKAIANANATNVTAGAEANRIQITGAAEATKIKAIGESTAEAYEKQVAAMGKENFTSLKLMESLAEGKVKIMPDILITGGGDGSNGPLSGMMGLQMMDWHRKTQSDNKTESETVKIVEPKILPETPPSDKK